MKAKHPPLEPTLDLLVALATLDEHEREAWIDHHMLDESLDRIADRMGFSRHYARLREQRAREKLAATFSHLKPAT